MHSPERRIATSVLVIGAGGSGLRAAIELAERGVDVLAVGKRPKTDAHTSLAAGGINAALATMDPEDTWQQHARFFGAHTYRRTAYAGDYTGLEIQRTLVGRATIETALERRETRGCPNRSDYPELDTELRVNLVWSGPGQVERQAIPPIPAEIATLMREVSTDGKLVE
ncbi:hypothetical protein Misp01_71950 [Microtetraspora sp. NBRC 13810]|uniref:FAD-dependent oxidoreductase n=1 Tax=Microtetraspora sp. NBRC 13810 TaxID=3030990 RepID=UPI0024A564B9|nr:FAD-dependent oxidoreductase [Microtetraspora sp. NBRC 13810]GLW12067.1 hypothetical protein Misp01_71950 [Microtetraspora sp. NBRC 13810]